MATADVTTISEPAMGKPPIYLLEVGPRLSESMNRCLLSLSALERLPILSTDILDAIGEGESYEMLVRKLVCLHNNILQISGMAARARYEPISRRNCPRQKLSNLK